MTPSIRCSYVEAAQVAPYHLDMQAKTVAANKPTTLGVLSMAGGRIVVTGDLAVNAGRQLRVASIVDPTAFGRTALIEALRRAGVSVSASPTGKSGFKAAKEGFLQGTRPGWGLRVAAFQPVHKADPQGQP